MDDNSSRYDKVVHITQEAGLSIEDQVIAISELFPSFDPTHTVNDEYLSDYIIEQYAYGRSMGMDVEQSAYAAEISNTLITICLDGLGLSLDRFLALIKAEIFASATMRRTQLAVVTDAAKAGDSKSAALLMEKIWPEHYAKKIVIEEKDDPDSKRSDDELDSRIRSLLAEIQEKKEDV